VTSKLSSSELALQDSDIFPARENNVSSKPASLPMPERAQNLSSSSFFFLLFSKFPSVIFLTGRKISL
jgi:hypothetical protein